MSCLSALLEEYRRIEDVQFWTDREKASARAVLRGVAVRAGIYREFIAATKAQDACAETAKPVLPETTELRAFGGFIRF